MSEPKLVLGTNSEAMKKIQDGLTGFRADQLGAMLTTCRRIMDEDESINARETARLLRLQVLAELARRGE
jgi:hypothetical protein